METITAKDLYTYRKKNGFCTNCGELVEKGRGCLCIRCTQIALARERIMLEEETEEHREHRLQKQKEWRENNRERVEYHQKQKRERYARMKAEGRCVDCGQPTNGTTLCEECAEIHNGWKRRNRDSL